MSCAPAQRAPQAPYDSGSGTSTLIFVYTVRDGDATNRLSYAGTEALALNGGTITVQSSGDPASTTLAEPGSADSLSNSSLVRIDALRPTVECRSIRRPATGRTASTTRSTLPPG